MSYSGVDWSKAPADATHWQMEDFGRAIWAKEVLLDIGPGQHPVKALVLCDGDTDFAPSFGYIGGWKESCTERP